MAPPAKRRKRNVLPSSSPESDNDDVEQLRAPTQAQMINLISSSPKSPKGSTTQLSKKSLDDSKKAPASLFSRAKATHNSRNATLTSLPKQAHGRQIGNKSASSSPEKPKRKGKSEDKVKSGDIFTFFTKQAQRQQAEGAGKANTSKSELLSQSSKDICIEDNDLISDDDVSELKAIPSSFVRQATKKRARGPDTFNGGEGGIPSSSQMFLVKPKEPNIRKEIDSRPWAERFAPVNLDELAVHKKKVTDVRGWIENVMEGKMRQRVLVLKGAAGTGKTTTVQLLAQSIDSDILEWRNPIGSVATADGYQSMTAQFEEFMGRGGKFGQLDIFSDNTEKPSNLDIKPLDRRKQIILIEEFPNTFTRSSTALQSFRSTILQYLASNTPPLSMGFSKANKGEPVTPVIMIISETLLTTTSASADSFTAHRLLGPEILQHPGVGIIEFNAIAPTLLAKGLELIVQKESRKSGRRMTPGPMVLKTLGEIGDIRSAIGSLEFMCIRGDVDGGWGAKVAFGKAKKVAKTTSLTRMEEESLELITRREASLGIFHAVGKVVYNKRELSTTGSEENLPSFLSLNARPKKPEVIVDELIDETGTDTQTFVAALHENYLLSCDASPTSFEFSSLDHVNGCLEALSDSDLLCPSWDGSFNSGGFGGGTGGRGSGGDILRQDEISFQIAVRGILFSLPYPVKRLAPASGGNRILKGADAHKMFYPTSLKLWRMREEIESTVDLWVSRLLKGDDVHSMAVTAGASAFARPKLGTVESWKSAQDSSTPSQKSEKETDNISLVGVGTSARKEMLLERLPYMTIIAKGRNRFSSSLNIREMEKVTSFHGIGGSSDETDERDDAAVIGEEWATDKPTEGKSPKKVALVVRGRGSASGLPLQQPEQKLVLSDDDIEDD